MCSRQSKIKSVKISFLDCIEGPVYNPPFYIIMAEKSKKFKAVLFDLDGTLLDTLQDIADSANAALKQLGFDEHPTEAYKYFVGDGIEHLAERALPQSSRDNNTVATCLELIRSEYKRRWDVNTRPYSGIREMLEALRQRNIPTAILSNKPHEFTCRMIDEYFGDYSFTLVRGAIEGVPIKPDPTAALQITRQMGISPGEFVYVGDSSTDMQTAAAAGMYAVGVFWGFRTKDELIQTGAEVVIERPFELVALFEENG